MNNEVQQYIALRCISPKERYKVPTKGIVIVVLVISQVQKIRAKSSQRETGSDFFFYSEILFLTKS